MSLEKKVYCGPVIRYKMKNQHDKLYVAPPDEPFYRIPTATDNDGWYVAMPNHTIGSEPRQFYNPHEEAWIFDDDETEDEMNWLWSEYEKHIKRLEKFAEVQIKWGFFVWWA
jgi:hypothetical protein